MLALYFNLFAGQHKDCQIINAIMLQLIRKSIAILLQPECEAKHENFFLLQASNRLIDCVKTYMSKQLSCSYVHRTTYCVTIDFQAYDRKNSNSVKIAWLSAMLLFPCFTSASLLFNNLTEKFIYVSLQWYLYVNIQNRYSCASMYVLKAQVLILMSSSCLFLNSTINQLSNFLKALSINLKSLKCYAYKYIKDLMYLLEFNCILKSSQYLLRPTKQAMLVLVDNIKRELYHKNKKGYWRISNQISSSTALLKTKQVLCSWYTSNLDLLNRSEVLKVNQTADYIFYRWQIK